MVRRRASAFMKANMSTSRVSEWRVMQGMQPWESNLGARSVPSSTCSMEMRASNGMVMGWWKC